MNNTKNYIFLLFTLLILAKLAHGQESIDNEMERMGLSKNLFSVSKTAENETIVQPNNNIIKGELYLNNTSANTLISFEGVTFENNVLIQGTKFSKDIYFIGSNFQKEAIFYDCEFFGNVYFIGATFNGGVSFLRSHFNNEVTFRESIFKTDANFSETTFKNKTNFSLASFLGKVDFSYSTFLSRSVDFSSSMFYNSIIFYKTKMPNEINFDGVSIEKEIDFTSIGNHVEDDKCLINLYGTTIDKIRLNYQQIKLQFEPKLSFDQISNIYYMLLKKQKNDGFTKSYELLDLDYQKIYYFKGIEKKYLYWINKIWWNFGYNKERIFLHALWMFSLFFIINYIGFEYFVNHVYVVNNLKEAIEKNRKKYIITKFKVKMLPAVFYYTSLIFFGLNLNIDNFNFSRPFGVAYIFAIYLSGLVCIAYMFNYIISI
ncbi:pentapeptide repeat-containing protein [Desulfosarcina variabilis]|uniref:pentapeptide repeat-containing protein n=1 Tax=Desulfosarcina variabilis TaxID=2300 RepID=UPI003AFB4FCC